jgi:hypothetical protein
VVRGRARAPSQQHEPQRVDQDFDDATGAAGTTSRPKSHSENDADLKACTAKGMPTMVKLRRRLW